MEEDTTDDRERVMIREYTQMDVASGVEEEGIRYLSKGEDRHMRSGRRYEVER